MGGNEGRSWVMRSVRGLVLRSVLVGVWSLPASSWAAPEAEALEAFEPPMDLPRSKVPGLAIWVEETVPDGESIREWIEERAHQVLGARDHELEDVDVIHIAVRGGPYAYTVHFGLVRNKKLIDGQLEVLACECGSDEMLKKVGEAIAAGAERLTKAADVERENTRAQKNREYLAAEERIERGRLPDVDGKHERRLGALGYTGIGLGVVGTGLLGVGISLSLRADEIREKAGSLYLYTTRPTGIALSVGGGIAVGTGVSLLLVDLLQSHMRSITVAPILERRQAGLSIAGAF